MILLRLGRWSNAAGRWFVWTRIYWRGYKWTPFVRVGWRYRNQDIADRCTEGGG